MWRYTNIYRKGWSKRESFFKKIYHSCVKSMSSFGNGVDINAPKLLNFYFQPSDSWPSKWTQSGQWNFLSKHRWYLFTWPPLHSVERSFKTLLFWYFTVWSRTIYRRRQIQHVFLKGKMFYYLLFYLSWIV